MYEGLGDGYLTQASQLNADKFGSGVWQQKKEAYANAVKYFGLASKAPSGFASSDARVLSRFAEACEGQAQMDAQELAAAAPGERESLIRERDELRSKSEDSMRDAREILAAGNVSSIDPNYRTVMIGQGNIIFGREVGASNEEKVDYYRQALVRYQEAAAVLPDDPRPLLYEGLCYERLTGIAQSPEEKHQQFAEALDRPQVAAAGPGLRQSQYLRHLARRELLEVLEREHFTVDRCSLMLLDGSGVPEELLYHLRLLPASLARRRDTDYKP